MEDREESNRGGAHVLNGACGCLCTGSEGSAIVVGEHARRAEYLMPGIAAGTSTDTPTDDRVDNNDWLGDATVAMPCLTTETRVGDSGRCAKTAPEWAGAAGAATRATTPCMLFTEPCRDIAW
mmetsp:Transcript_45777/g.119085  ORF Transcript_45777/g.119085 Transcript_45777/m.119085 type:complete len:123 (-) Transcript_45777:693-1061(-)